MSCDSFSIRSRGFGVIVKMTGCDGVSPFDVSVASSVAARFYQGSAEINAVMTNLNDGKDGKVIFITPSGSQYFSNTGRWNVELTPIFPDGGQYPTTVDSFIVTS